MSINEYHWLTPKQITLPGGSTQKRSYDGLLNLESLEVKTANQQQRLTLSNTYGPRQELTQRTRTDITDSSSSTVANTYQYDPELRLTQTVTDTGGLFGKNTETFTLDQVTNRTQHSKTSGEWQYDQNNRLKQKGNGSCGNNGTTCYQWDERGNLTEKQEGSNTTRYTYDSSNRLVEVKNNNQLTARYGYDPFNRRLWKEKYRDKQGNPKISPQRTYYLYSDEGLIGESIQSITITGETVTANTTPEISTQYGPTPDGLFSTNILFTKIRNSNNEPITAYYHYDHLSTPIQATDKEGNIVWSATYEAFGKATITTPNPSQEKPTIISNLRFPGQYEDEETGLHYNFNRYYDAETGRYITQDPIGLEGGTNFYAYVFGNPIVWGDPSGFLASHVKSYICSLLESPCNWDVKCAQGAANTDRQRTNPITGRNDWNNPKLRQAENFLYAAGNNDVPYYGVIGHAIFKIPRWVFNQSSIPSAEAVAAGLEGVNHQGMTPEQWREWCNDCKW